MTNNYFSFPITATRFKSLGFANQKRGDWRFFDTSTGKPCSIGSAYKTKTELLADLQRFGTQWAG